MKGSGGQEGCNAPAAGSVVIECGTEFTLPYGPLPAGFNTLLRYLSPLVISLACNLEPLLGSLFGWAAGVVAAPGPWTFVGGSLVMLSTAVVSLASHRREQQQASREAASRAIQRILSGDGEMQQLEKDEEGEALALTAAGDDGGWGEPWELSPRPGGGTGGGRSSRDGRPPDAG